MTSKQTFNYIAVLYLVVLVLLPFHAFFTTWLGSNFGHLDVWRIWKELLIVGTLPTVAYGIWTDPRCRRWLKTDWLPRLIGIYIGLYLLWGMWALAVGHVNTEALVYSWLSNLRFLGFFLLVIVVALRSTLMERYAIRVVLATGAVVAVFGLLQVFVLPIDFLRHFGYGPDTIPAVQTIDNKLDYQRIQSTLRGANPLGAYLVVLISLVVAEWRSVKRRSAKLIWYDVALVLALFFTYSRSAYLGAIASVPAIIWLTIRKPATRRLVVGMATAIVLLGCVGIFMLRDNSLVQNTVFHSDETSASAESSNAGRTRALSQGLHDVVHEPLGRGPGTAGPASVRNDHPGRIAENYYLQVGQEVGLLGMGLFVAICVLVARRLWQVRQQWLGMGLLASLIGLSVVNLVSHAWPDDTLGLLWWGLAAVAIAPIIRRKYYETKEKD